MAFPIITLLFAGIVAFLAFSTGGVETGMDDAPAASTSAPVADEAPVVEEAAGEE